MHGLPNLKMLQILFIYFTLFVILKLSALSSVRVYRCGFIPSSITQVIFLLHSLMQASNTELVYIDNRWINALYSIILLVFVT